MAKHNRHLKWLNTHLTWLMIGLVAISWSWLWFINVVRLSSRLVTGYITVLLVFSIIVSLSGFIFWVAIWYLRRSKPGPWLIFKIAAIWALAELMVSWLVAIIWLGTQGSWDSVLPFASFSLIIVHTPLRYLARFFGFYGLSGIVIAATCTVVMKSLRRYALAIWGAIVALTVLGWYGWRPTAQPPVVVTLISQILGQTPQVTASDGQLIVLPEYGLDLISSHNLKYFLKTPTGLTAHFVGTKQLTQNGNIQNTIIYGSTNKGFLRQTAKTRLIPGGEYLPYIAAPLIHQFDPTTYSDFQVRRAVVKGHQPVRPFNFSKGLVVGAEACSSIIATKDYRRLTEQGATILTNSASLDIFEGSRLFSWQQQSFGQFIAVANARSFVQSASDGQAYAINPNGHIQLALEPTTAKSITMAVNTKRTLYTRTGEWVPLLGLGIVALDVGRLQKIKTKKLKRT